MHADKSMADQELARGHGRRHRDAVRTHPRIPFHLALPGVPRIPREFELNVECYGRDFADEMCKIIENKLGGAREVTLAEVDERSYPAQLRDSIARLLSPYL
jgi:hypothetical protein